MVLSSSTVFILFVMGVCLIWELYCLAFVNRTIKVVGAPPYKNVTMPVITVLFVIVYLWRYGFTAEHLIVVGTFVVLSALYMVIKSGVSERGIVVNGWLTPYRKIQYFDFEKADENRVRLIGHCATKERLLIYTKEQKELVTAYFVQSKVDSPQQFRDKVNNKH